ncbi:MAG: hypothetical protein Q9216_001804 [Gyalolechia sp. 2 TL-2023]
MSSKAEILPRQIWANPTPTSTGLPRHCTPFRLPSGGLIAIGENNTFTLTQEAVFQPYCTSDPDITLNVSRLEAIGDHKDPFYASTLPQMYAIAAVTVVSYLLVIMLFITPRTFFVGGLGGGGGFLGQRGMISGASGSASVIGVGGRPWLQKVAALTVAISLTIASVDTFRVAERQYSGDYTDVEALTNEVVNTLELRIVRVVSETFLWLAQAQTLIRLFPRHKEKVIIKWAGFVLIGLDTIFSILNNFVSGSSRSAPRRYQSAVPALSYLFTFCLSLIYAAWIIYYSLSKRRYAFFHPKMRNICLVALLSYVAVLIPVVFFILDISIYDVAAWGNYVRWVGAAAASVVVWEWVERIEALERDERKDGILGREIFDGDEMLEITPSSAATWSSSHRFGGSGGGDHTPNIHFRDVTSVVGKASRARRRPRRGRDRMSRPGSSPPVNGYLRTAAGQKASIQFSEPTPPDTVATPLSASGPTRPQSAASQGSFPQGTSSSIQQRSSESSCSEKPDSPNYPGPQVQGASTMSFVARSFWDTIQKIPIPFLNRHMSPPIEVKQAVRSSQQPEAIEALQSPPHPPASHSHGLLDKIGLKKSAPMPRPSLPITIVPAPPRNPLSWNVTRPHGVRLPNPRPMSRNFLGQAIRSHSPSEQLSTPNTDLMGNRYSSAGPEMHLPLSDPGPAVGSSHAVKSNDAGHDVPPNVFRADSAVVSRVSTEAHPTSHDERRTNPSDPAPVLPQTSSSSIPPPVADDTELQDISQNKNGLPLPNTIDLQDQDSPSAKDHTRQPAHPAPYGDGPPAPHQERALKHAEQETAVELHHTRSPRVSQDLSGKELQLLQEDGDGYVNSELISPHQDQQINQRNGGAIGGAGAEADAPDAEDEGLEDDLMDKISSSPSIDEGGSSTPSSWPSRADSLQPARFMARTPSPIPHIDFSSSPFLSTPPYFPPLLAQKKQDLEDQSEVHHHQGGYPENECGDEQTTADDSFSSEMRDQLGPLISEKQRDPVHDEWEGLEDSVELDPTDFHHLLLPSDDPLLDNSFDDADLSASSSESSSIDSGTSWKENEHVTGENGSDDNSSDDDNDDDDDTEDVSFKNDPRYIDSGWGGECLRDIEDIDFEFVYALHTFVATVEGQANATKGDTMVLLDDSNSYWWLVRVVKDSSIGYLPAEHIETPTERLARLNKHRNIDLSQTMLSDAPEKSRNPLKKAMKRRNGKAVQFAAPTYVEASDVEYSTEEEDEEGDGEYLPNEEERPENQESDQEPRQDDSAVVEPLKTGTREVDTTSEPQAQIRPINGTDHNSGVERARTSDEMFESLDNDTTSKSRKGTLRNTDSLFKDDNTETRKINLTPSLLRDDSSSSTVRSVESKELKNRPSIDSLEKGTSSPEKSKDDRKRKEKKGMLSGFFKRKDKKGRNMDDLTEDADKTSEETVRQTTGDASGSEGQAPRLATQPQPQRSTSKLQKSPPSKLSPKPSLNYGESPSIRSVIIESEKPSMAQSSRSPPRLNMEFESAPLVEPESRQPNEPAMAPAPLTSTDAPRDERMEIESPKSTRHGMFSPIRDVLRSSPSSSEPKPEKAKKAKHRMPIDDLDSSSDTEDQAELPSHASEERPAQAQHVESDRDRLSESPVQVSPQEQPQTQHPPALMIDTSSQDDPSTSPISPLSSAELVDAPNDNNARDETPASTAQSSANAPTWSDAHLRAYLEDNSEVRDLLLVVHNKVDVKPAPRDHPLVKNLFKEENRKLGEMSNRLDGLLVIGGEQCKRVTKTPKHGETFKIGQKISVKALHTPCHTQDSICWLMEDGDEKVVFTGDTLFIGGCGRFFEGSAAEMHTALNTTLATLPDDTRVYPGHEYTKQNVKFLTTILDTEPVKKLQAFAENNQQTQGKFTIGDEKASRYNVFMRVTDPAVQKATGETDPVDVMTKLREMKNNM